MFQVRSERSAEFYDLSLYRDADVVVTSGAVRLRYEENPADYFTQVVFYDSLEAHFQRVVSFGAEHGVGPAISVYVNPLHKAPFGGRRVVSGPDLDREPKVDHKSSQDAFFGSLALNYEVFGHYENGLDCYDYGLRHSITREESYENLALGKTRCLLALNRTREAVAFLAEAAGKTESQRTQQHLHRLRQQIMARIEIAD
jgi:hypothetical protein